MKTDVQRASRELCESTDVWCSDAKAAFGDPNKKIHHDADAGHRCTEG